MNTDFNSCSTKELQTLINKAKEGTLDLHNYWNVNDIRLIKIPKSKLSKPTDIDLYAECTIEHIGNPGRGQQIEIETFVGRVPEDLQAEVRELLPELIKAEFGRGETLPDDSIRHEDVKWTATLKRTAPSIVFDVIKKVGPVAN